MRVLLLHMPLASPNVPSLAVQLLAAILEESGIHSDVFYGTTRLRRTPVLESFIHGVPGEVIFTPFYYTDLTPEIVARQMVECSTGREELRANYRGFERLRNRRQRQRSYDTWPIPRRPINNEWPFGSPDDELLSDLLTHMDLTRACLDQCMKEISIGEYEVFAFSMSFDAQRMASLALAKRLKEREPKAKIVFGGTACDGDMGHQLMEHFPCIDVVSQGDADLTIVPLMNALSGQQPMESVPNIIYRKNAKLCVNPSAPFLENLDSLPIPDYTQFLDQLANSDWRDEQPLILYEASRGCWWGERHHCKFCGLRADGLAYRRKSAHRTRSELDLLATKFPVNAALYATDAILDFRYLTEFLPTLEELNKRHKWKLFFEVKSNLRKVDIAMLAESGVKTVQPGIESLSDHVLILMDKGNSGAKHVQLLKWLDAYKVSTIYNLIIGTPGEVPEDYEETLQLIPALTHLQPPSFVNLLNLDRFSPYFREPSLYGIYDTNPEEAYSVIYADPAIDHSKLAYKHSYRSVEKDNPDLQAVWERLREVVRGWHQARLERSFRMISQPNELILMEDVGGKRKTDRLRGLSAEIYYFCDKVRSFEEICRAFPMIAESALRACLESWISQRWMFRFRSGVYLSLAVEVSPPSAQELSRRQLSMELLAVA